jgi:hypothetical protein
MEKTMARKSMISAKVRKYLAKFPNAKAQVVADATGATAQYVHNIRYMDNKKQELLLPPILKTKNKWKFMEAVTSDTPIADLAYEVSKGRSEQRIAELVDHPAHYKVGGIETIDFIDAKEFGYNLGNVVKYISRADHKGSHYEDLCKARWYLNREIAKFSPQPEVTK